MLTEAVVEPRNAIEELLADIWAYVLQVERVSIYDNFFELGGHSLLIVQVIVRIRSVFNVEVSLQMFFEAPRIVDVARKIEELQQVTYGLIAPPFFASREPVRSLSPFCSANSGSSNNWHQVNPFTTSRSASPCWVPWTCAHSPPASIRSSTVMRSYALLLRSRRDSLRKSLLHP